MMYKIYYNGYATNSMLRFGIVDTGLIADVLTEAIKDVQ